jgi:hypothetical protein
VTHCWYEIALDRPALSRHRLRNNWSLWTAFACALALGASCSRSADAQSLSEVRHRLADVQWRAGGGVYPVTRVETVILSVEAVGPLVSDPGTTRPQLEVFCLPREGTYGVALTVSNELPPRFAYGVKHPLRLQFDGERPHTEWWQTGENHQTLFLPAGTANAHIRKLSHSNRLRIELQRGSNGQLAIEFDVRSFRSQSEFLRRRCALP